MKKEYIITFHTHYEAILCKRSLESKEGLSLIKMIPVPRELSSSCGTALRLEATPSFEASIFSSVEHDEVFLLEQDGTYSKINDIKLESLG